MSCFGRCLVRLSRNCRRTSGEWGRTFPWASLGSDCNFDFNLSFTEEQQREGTSEYNYWPGGHAGRLDATPSPPGIVRAATSVGTDTPTYLREHPGMSAFGLEEGVVYHTYFTYARGLDANWGMYQWLDRAPRGRNKEFGATGGATTTSTTSAEPSHG